MERPPTGDSDEGLELVGNRGRSRDGQAPSGTRTVVARTRYNADLAQWAPSRDEAEYEKELEEYQKLRERHVKRLAEVDEFWQKKVEFLESEICRHSAALEDKEEELNMLTRPPEKVFPGPSWLTWVESVGFNLVASLIVIANLAAMCQESLHRTDVFWLNQFFLLFFLTELILRGFLYQRELLCGLSCQVCSNWLDLVIVAGGVVDLWLLPLLGSSKNSPGAVMLRPLRLLRLARVLKLFNVFMRVDLSWTERDWFQAFVMGVIGVSSIMMSFETDFADLAVWFYWEQAVLIAFSFELAARMKQMGLHEFLCSPEDRLWNYFDTFIVGASVTDQWLLPTVAMVRHMAGMPRQRHNTGLSQFLGVLRILRLFRILRLLRLIKSIPPLYNLLQGITHAMASMMWVGVLAGLILYAFGLFAVKLLRDGLVEVSCEGDIDDACPWEKTKDGEWGESNHPRCTFTSVFQTMFILFELMNGHMSPVEDLLNCVPFIKPALITYMGVSCMTILPILTAVVSENMLNSTEATKARIAQETEEADRRHKKAILNELFDTIDLDQSGEITRDEFSKMLKKPHLADLLAVSSNLKVSELEQLFSLLERNKVVKRDTFMKSLELENSEVHERSIMRFEKRLQHIDKTISDLTSMVKVTRDELKWLSGQLCSTSR